MLGIEYLPFPNSLESWLCLWSLTSLECIWRLGFKDGCLYVQLVCVCVGSKIFYRSSRPVAFILRVPSHNLQRGLYFYLYVIKTTNTLSSFWNVAYRERIVFVWLRIFFLQAEILQTRFWRLTLILRWVFHWSICVIVICAANVRVYV